MDTKSKIIGGFLLGTMVATMARLLVAPEMEDRDQQFRTRKNNLVNRLTRCRQELVDFIHLCRTNT